MSAWPKGWYSLSFACLGDACLPAPVSVIAHVVLYCCWLFISLCVFAFCSWSYWFVPTRCSSAAAAPQPTRPTPPRVRLEAADVWQNLCRRTTLSDSRPSEVLLDFKTQRGTAAILMTTACFLIFLRFAHFVIFFFVCCLQNFHSGFLLIFLRNSLDTVWAVLGFLGISVV